jgi:hypothetical protein
MAAALLMPRWTMTLPHALTYALTKLLCPGTPCTGLHHPRCIN